MLWLTIFRTCQAILQGHTSLVGQLQMRGNTLVTGGSDGSVRVWSLEKMAPIHRLAAHDNSVTSLQFDDNRVVSGGSDGRVKVWDLKTGHLVRELTAPADAVWRVAFEDEKCVVMASRSNRTIMEVWSFSPPEEVLYERPAFPTSSVSTSASPSHRMVSSPPRPLSAVEYRTTALDQDQTMTGVLSSHDREQLFPSFPAPPPGREAASNSNTDTDPSEDVDMTDASEGRRTERAKLSALRRERGMRTAPLPDSGEGGSATFFRERDED